MNTKQLIALLVTAAAAGSVLAQSAPSADAGAKPGASPAASPAAKAPASQAAPAGLTRAQVIAELIEARKNGLIPETEADYDVAQTKKHFVK